MDSKRLKFDSKDTLKDIDTFSSFPVAGDSPTKVYLYLKAQRLSIALHLVTNHIKDIEPAKFEVRKNAILIVESVSKLNRVSERDRQEVIGTLSEVVFITIALLETLVHVGLISLDNGSVIKRELVFLVRLADGHIFNTENQGRLDHEVFNVPSVRRSVDVQKTGVDYVQKRQFKKSVFFDKTQSGENLHDLEKKETPFAEVAKGSSISIGHIGQSLSDNRISSIIGLLKARSGLSVKDFMEVIPGVSEKTIQRELSVLASKGIVTRVGERRWTRYSIAS